MGTYEFLQGPIKQTIKSGRLRFSAKIRKQAAQDRIEPTPSIIFHFLIDRQVFLIDRQKTHKVIFQANYLCKYFSRAKSKCDAGFESLLRTLKLFSELWIITAYFWSFSANFEFFLRTLSLLCVLWIFFAYFFILFSELWMFFAYFLSHVSSTRFYPTLS